MPLSAKQMEYLALAWQCFDSEPKIDYAKFATVAGLASAASARELMRVTKNKLKVEYGALSSNLQTSNGSPAPRTPSKKAAGTTPKATPASRKRGRPAKVAAEESFSDEEVEAEAPVAKKAKVKAATPASTVSNGGSASVQVKREPVLEERVSEAEEEVSFF